MSTAVQVEGTVASGYEGVADAFAANFRDGGDLGASCTVYVAGEVKVDVWGGIADPATGAPWERDTVALVYSATKGATALVCHLLAADGTLDLDAPVARWWPEFAAGGKQDVTIRQIMSHRAGLPHVEAQLSREAVLDGRAIVTALAGQTPLWAPGTAHGYHAFTYGWLLGEVVLRATGSTVGQVFAERVAGPLGLDFHIGLPASERPRVAQLVNAAPDPGALDAIADPAVKADVLALITAAMDPTSLLARVLSTDGALPTPVAEVWNDPAVWAAEIPAANGITNARSLARMYAGVLDDLGPGRLLDDAAVDAARAEQGIGPDVVTLVPSHFASGFMLPSVVAPLLSAASFGHTGAGGSLGFADVDARVGFGYVQNVLGASPVGEPRNARLVDALAAALA